MKHHLLFFLCLCFLGVLSCSNGDEDDYTKEDIPDQDTIIVDKKDTLIVNQDTIVVDKKDTIIIEKDYKDETPFIVLSEDESIDFNIEKVVYWMSQPRGFRSKQGADAYNGYLFQLQGGHSYVDILDIKNKAQIATVEIAIYDIFHCNNADFSSSFYDKFDDFPLFYSSQQDRYARCVVADRITKQGDYYVFQTVQRINLPSSNNTPLLYTPDAVVDRENGYLYVYTGNTIPITDFYIYQFRLPKIDEGEVVQLSERDILSKWVIKGNPAYYKQGGMMKDGLLITLEGMSDNKMRIIDLKNHRYKLIDLAKDYGAKWEPEDIFEVDGELFIASGATGIYKIELSGNKE